MTDKPKLTALSYAAVRDRYMKSSASADSAAEANIAFYITAAPDLKAGESIGGIINEKAGFYPAGKHEGHSQTLYPIHRKHVAKLLAEFEVTVDGKNIQPEAFLAGLGIDQGGRAH